MIFERQGLHFIILLALVTGLYFVSNWEPVREGQIWGIESLTLYWIAVGIPVVHQIYVWACWRFQLHFSSLTRLFGKGAFGIYSIGFAVLGILRIAVVFPLALANSDTIAVNEILLKSIAILFLVPAIYLFYSVGAYFGFKRALGIDHFFDRYRYIPFERRGIFRFTRNGMYTFGFLIFWAPALWWGSLAALVVAIFNHLYIWVHYYTTELPDIYHIYKRQ